MRCIGFIAAVGLFILSCSSSSEHRAGGGEVSGGAGGSIGVGSGGAAGTGIIVPGNDGGQLPPLDGQITPGGSSVTVSGQPVEVQFHFKLNDGSEPRVVW